MLLPSSGCVQCLHPHLADWGFLAVPLRNFSPPDTTQQQASTIIILNQIHYTNLGVPQSYARFLLYKSRQSSGGSLTGSHKQETSAAFIFCRAPRIPLSTTTELTPIAMHGMKMVRPRLKLDAT